MYPWQKSTFSSYLHQEAETRRSNVVFKAGDESSSVSSVLTRCSQRNGQFNQERYSLENIAIDFEPDADIEIENTDRDRGLIESLMKHIEMNAKQTKDDINNEFNTLIWKLNEQRNELMQQVDREIEKKMNILRTKRRRCSRSLCLDDSNELVGHVSRLRSSDDLNIETDRDVRTIENLRPLQCGDLKFTYDSDLYEKLNEFGNIEDSLASGLHSEAMGLGLNYSFVDEEAKFKVVTRNNNMNKAFSGEDNIKVVIKSPNDQVTTALISTKTNGIHTVTYSPSTTGLHKIHIFVNKFELIESPFSCSTLSKETLAFELKDTFLPGSDSAYDWVLNKEETTALLESNEQTGAVIFGATSFSDGKHGWKIKFTSACTGVSMAIGVSQKTRIIDIYTRHTCTFRLDTIENRHSALRRTRSQRKMSTFHRESRTFFVLLDLDEYTLTIICCETEERQNIVIPKHSENLFPCVYMVHECKKSVCPRPLVAFS